ncbi:unnamed protein product [Cyclocybe aegerita]|uniref:Cytochrome P450 monooxygenase pc-3 n=1 Tax=Cyclocybe aegerita TaxID=1973307 RepID=A0A8S0W3V8_CYCAE|nr:unnamed protein product [Cyclocybe aegerita]
MFGHQKAPLPSLQPDSNTASIRTATTIMGLTLPRGLVYLVRLIPYFAAPSAAVFLAFRVANDQFDISAPAWAVISLTLFARPLLFFAEQEWSKVASKRRAAAHGAVLPPMIKESAFGAIKIFGENLKTGYPAEPIRKWAEEYGHTFQMPLLTSNLVATDEPDHIKAILATQFDGFDKGPTFRDQMNSLLGVGVFNADGDMWKFHRSMTRPFFTRERISDFEIYDRNADASLKLAKTRLAEGYSIDFQDLVSRFTLDSATEFLFGYNVDSLSAGIPYPPAHAELTPASFHEHSSTVFTTAFTKAQVIAAKRTGQGPDWPLFEKLQDTIHPLRKIMDRYTEPVIREGVEKKVAEKGEKMEEESTLLEHLLKHTQDQQILKDELVNLLVAGRDTTMCLLTFSAYMLAEHPNIERRLRQEIYEKIGPNGLPTYDNMRELKFVRAFLNEVLRLYPPVPANVRTTTREVVLPAKRPGQQAFYIPAGTSTIYTVINTHRRPDLWGPDAHKFDPDRFLDERVHKYLTPNPFIFCPFNAGPRICLGQQFAYHEATFYLIRLLQQFTAFTLDSATNKPPPEAWASMGPLDRKSVEKIHPLSHLTLYVSGGLWLRMRELQAGEA